MASTTCNPSRFQLHNTPCYTMPTLTLWCAPTQIEPLKAALAVLSQSAESTLTDIVSQLAEAKGEDDALATSAVASSPRTPTRPPIALHR